MNRSIRCRHGFDRDVVPCWACGDHDSLQQNEARSNAAKNIRRRSQGNRHRNPAHRVDPVVPSGYDNADGVKRGQGNGNARVRY